MAVAACRWPGNTSMELLERERMVADAIILERAVRVLQRRNPKSSLPAVQLDRRNTAIGYMGGLAADLRREAEPGG